MHLLLIQILATGKGKEIMRWLHPGDVVEVASAVNLIVIGLLATLDGLIVKVLQLQEKVCETNHSSSDRHFIG